MSTGTISTSANVEVPPWQPAGAWDLQRRTVRHLKAGRDLLCGIAITATVAYVWAHQFVNNHGVSRQMFACVLLYNLLLVLVSENRGLYRKGKLWSTAAALRATAGAVLTSSLFTISFLALLGAEHAAQVIGVSAALNLAVLGACRLAEIELAKRRAFAGQRLRQAIVIGDGAFAGDFAGWLTANPQLGYLVRQCLPEEICSDPARLSQLSRSQFIDTIFVTGLPDRGCLQAAIEQARLDHIDIEFVPDWTSLLGQAVRVEYVGTVATVPLHREPTRPASALLKRIIDVAGAALLLLCCAPLLLLVAILITFDSPGPVLYRSLRIGRRGRKFVCYKFRTMVQNADQLKERLREQNQRSGPFFKLRDDPRITSVGKFLRRYSIDELPQLYNVLKGDMSLVGPRPHPVDDVSRYQIEHLRRLDVTPGMTGLWQIKARQDPSFDASMALDLEYIETWTPLLDLQILFSTFSVVVRGTGQ